MKKLFCILFFIISFANFATPPEESRQPARILTPPDATAGKWFISIAIGSQLGMSKAGELRNAMLPIFASHLGGMYRVAIDINDQNQGSPVPTRKNVIDALNSLKVEIEYFKVANRDAPTMVMIALVGHGEIGSRGEFEFHFEDETMDGESLAKLIVGLGVEETILVMQSCNSGDLANKVFPKLVETMVKNIQSAQSEKRRFAVLVPVPAELESPVHEWESLIARSLTDPDVDLSGKGYVDFNDWINYIRRHAIQSQYFNPEPWRKFATRLHLWQDKKGFDPQIYSFGFSGSTPLFFTQVGYQKYSTGDLEWPTPIFTPVLYTDRTYAAYRWGAIKFLTWSASGSREGSPELVTEIVRLATSKEPPFSVAGSARDSVVASLSDESRPVTAPKRGVMAWCGRLVAKIGSSFRR